MILPPEVWWYGQQLRERDEIRAAQQGAYVHYEAKEVQASTWSNYTVFQSGGCSWVQTFFFKIWESRFVDASCIFKWAIKAPVVVKV